MFLQKENLTRKTTTNQINKLLVIVGMLSVGNSAAAQNAVDVLMGQRFVHERTGQQNNAMKTAEANPNWTANQKKLIEGSKAAILKTGMSEPYFNKHFSVVQVIDKPSDRRVVWKFTINEYEATVTDSIGYYTEGVERRDVHSVGNTLSSTSDIKRTISRRRALRIMRSCLGRFANPAVEYSADGSGKAKLALTAHSVPRLERVRKDRRKRENELRERAEKEGRDVIDEEEEDDRPPVFLASVDLVTGRCVKGIGQAGPPRPR